MIHREDRDSVAILRIDYGEGNLMDVELLNEIEQSLDEVVQSGAKALVLTGNDSVFMAGGNILPGAELGRKYFSVFLPTTNKVNKHLFTLPLPTVAAVNGDAIADGCFLATACDYRVMTNGTAQIGLNGLVLGVPMPVTLLEVFRYLIPTHYVQALLYTGKLQSPSEALKIGLVDALASPGSVVDQACKVASQLGQIPNESFVINKQQIRQPAVERIERYSRLWDKKIVNIWSSPEILARIRVAAKNISGVYARYVKSAPPVDYDEFR